MQGWIKLHRMLQQWEWYNDSQTLHVFITVLLNANHEDGRWRGHEVKRGQWITGRKKLSEITGISERSIRTILKRLEDSQELTIKATSKFSLISVIKWDSYQIVEPPIDQPYANKRPATDQRPTTNKNEENEKKEDCREIIEYLNSKIGKSYKWKTDATQKAIRGRISEGYSLPDFKKVIDSKVSEWAGTDSEKYLTPSTLFRPSNFEKYFQNAAEPEKPEYI